MICLIEQGEEARERGVSHPNLNDSPTCVRATREANAVDRGVRCEVVSDLRPLDCVAERDLCFSFSFDSKERLRNCAEIPPLFRNTPFKPKKEDLTLPVMTLSTPLGKPAL